MITAESSTCFENLEYLREVNLSKLDFTSDNIGFSFQLVDQQTCLQNKLVYN